MRIGEDKEAEEGETTDRTAPLPAAGELGQSDQLNITGKEVLCRQKVEAEKEIGIQNTKGMKAH
jgi:hypothetical protein